MAKEEKKPETCCYKCQRVCFNIGLLMSFIFFIIIPILHSYATSYNYLMQPAKWALIQGFCDFFIASFAILYLFASLTIFVRYYQKRRLCRMDNCSFYIFTAGIFALGLVGQNYIEKSSLAHETDFNYTCAELELQDNIAADSFINEMNQVFKSARSVMCGAKCPCGMLLEAKPTGIVIDADGPTSVDRCEEYYMEDVFGGDEDKQWHFEEAFALIEEEHVCSGICKGVNDDPLDIFLFSNVNDGLPLVTCRLALFEEIENNIWYFHKVYLTVIVMSGIMIGLLGLMLFCQCFLCCRRKCCKKGAQQSANKSKNRAQNGMVVGGADQEEDSSPQVELADVRENKQSKSGKTRSTALPPPSADDADRDNEEGKEERLPSKKMQKSQKEPAKKVDSQVSELTKAEKKQSKKENQGNGNDVDSRA